MNIKLMLSVIISVFATLGYAGEQDKLDSERKATCVRYLIDLQNADYKGIVQLFDKNGYVISTSKGHMNAKDFFYSFLPNIRTAKTELHETFIGSGNYVVRFSFDFEMKDGEKGHGEYIDEFVFVPNMAKIMSVAMFENLHFE